MSLFSSSCLSSGPPPAVPAARHRVRRSTLCRGVLVVCCLLAGTALPASQSASREYQLKAAFLYNFTRFIEWPPKSLAGPTSPIVIGVFGRDPFDGALEATVAGRKVNGHPIVVTHVDSFEEASRVQLLFVGSGREAELAQLLGALDGRPVLTVGETDDFERLDGMIDLVLEDDKIRFSIDKDVAIRAGLRISAQLQKLATSVRTGERAP